MTRLVICDWHGGHRRDTTVDPPSWSDVESAIRALNNRDLNDIYLHAPNTATWLYVDGQAGHYAGNRVVDLPSVLRAAKSFYDAGGFAPDAGWVNT